MCHKCATLLARLCQRTGTSVPKAWQGRANTLAQGQQDNFEKQARLLRRTSVESSHFTSQSKAFRVLFCTSLVHSYSFFFFQSLIFVFITLFPKTFSIMKNVSRLLPLLSGIVTLSGCSHAPQKSNGQNNQKPNIIYIFADDLGIGDLSCYGAT